VGAHLLNGPAPKSPALRVRRATSGGLVGRGSAPLRGQLLDLAVVGAQWSVVGPFGDLVLRTLGGADRGRGGALAAGLVFVAALLLPALGAHLKRWSLHQRWAAVEGGAERFRPGCLVHPVVHLSLSLTLVAGAVATLGAAAFGPDFVDRGGPFVGAILLGMVLAVVQTVVVFRTFEPPRRPPRSAFLRGPAAALLGDACLFLNMLLFQVAWDLVAATPFARVASFEEFVGRLLYLGLAAALVYLPPRLFYLVEDLRRPGAWFTMGLAVATMVARALLGTR